MYVVEVLPLAKGVRAQTLSYFAPENVPGGTLVTAPMRSRNINAVVTKCTPARDMKAELKQMPYEMKEINEIGKQLFFRQYIEAARSFSRFSGVTAGAAIQALTPTQIIKNSEDLPDVTSDIYLPDITAPEPKIIQAKEKKQYSYFNSLIQSNISADESVFVCTPTTHQAQLLEESIETSATIIRLDSTLTKNTLLSRWREIVTSNTPIVIIGTVPFLSVPRADLGLIIVADEINEAYKMIGRPNLDKRLFARHLAESYKRNCVLSGNVLSTETLWEYRNDKIDKAYKPNFRYDGPDGELIDMKELSDSKAKGVKVFSPVVAKAIRKVVGNGEKMLLFVARRGQRPFTVCNDCGSTIACNTCGYPLVLKENESGERSFICRSCHTESTSYRRCDNCHSWRLEALGVGIDFVANILQENVPELNLFQIDGDNTKNKKQVTEKLKEFQAANSGVLITTQLGINHMRESVDMSAVITIDSLLALPDLSISEKLFSLLLSIREKTDNKFFIQTRSDHTDIFNHALSGDVTSFYRDQIAEREKFSYPPFSYLIKLSASGKIETVKKHMQKVRKLFAGENIRIYPGSGGKDYTAHALLSIDTDRWVDEEVLGKLRSLPLAVDVNAHPRSLL